MESAMNLTPRQLDVIVAIRNYRHLHGYSPTMQELADQLGTSKVTIFEHVGALSRAYAQIGATRLAARRLARGVNPELDREQQKPRVALLDGLIGERAQAGFGARVVRVDDRPVPG